MTTCVPDLDGSTALLAEWRTWLRGDPRHAEPDVPPSRCIERTRAITQDLIDHQHHAAQESADV